MTAPREIRVDAGEGSFRALAWPGAGPRALLVHATSFCAETWAPVWAAAAQAGCGWSAVAVDQRGHGGSFAPEGVAAYAWTRLVDDVVALASHFAAETGERALLVGHSSGATACLAAAGAAPGPVCGVVAVEPVLFDRPTAPDTDSFGGSRMLSGVARKRRREYSSRAAAREALAKRFPYSGFAPESLDAYCAGGFDELEDGGVRLRCAPEVEAAGYDGAAALDLWPLAARIAAPVLVLAAERSAISPPHLERLRAAADVRVETVEAASHFAALEQPAAVGWALARFAAELP